MSSRSHKILMLVNNSGSEDASKTTYSELLENGKDSAKQIKEKENIPERNNECDKIDQPSELLENSKDSAKQIEEKENIPERNNEMDKIDQLSSIIPIAENKFTSAAASTRSSRSSSTSSSSSGSSCSTCSSSSSTSSSGSTHSCFAANSVQPIVLEQHEEPSDSTQTSSSPSLFTLQNVEPILTNRGPVVNYEVSPINTDESDVDLSDNDPTYIIEQQRRRQRLVSVSSSTSENSDVTTVKSRKRKADPTRWKQNVQKMKRNSGQEYISCHSKKVISAREMKPPCTQKCKLKCSENINYDLREEHFKSFWAMGDLQMQRMFILSSITIVTPKYKYTNAERPRAPNSAYHLSNGDEKVRVCKTFFCNTLGITQKMIRTARSKATSGNYLGEDKRGKHNSHKTVSEELKNDIIEFINTIPRIESHYLRASTSREYIGGGKSIADLFRDFQAVQKDKNLDSGRFHTFYDIFTNKFNIGFFMPKKDQCDLCLQYHNSTNSQKETLQEKYDSHIREKNLSRDEKRKVRKAVDECNLCVCFDVQAIMQSPNGDTSSFYYKSKLNSYNFTMTELNKLKEGDECRDDYKSYEDVYCYFWEETQGKRGAVEIGSCVLDYFAQSI